MNRKTNPTKIYEDDHPTLLAMLGTKSRFFQLKTNSVFLRNTLMPS